MRTLFKKTMCLAAAASMYAAAWPGGFRPQHKYRAADGICYMLDDGKMTAMVTFDSDSLVVLPPEDGVYKVDFGVTYKGDVVIPDSVYSDGKAYCVGSIGYAAFMNSREMTSVTIGRAVKEIGHKAFCNCEGLTAVVIPASVTQLQPEAFCGCNGLARLAVEEGNNRYDSREGCNAVIETETNTLVYGIGSTRIPASVRAIGIKAFANCTTLTAAAIPDRVTSIGERAFRGCTALTELTVPDSVTSIGDGAFRGCTALTSVVMGRAVRELGRGVFDGCGNIGALTCRSTTPPACGEEALDGIDKTACRLYVPRGSADRYRAAEGWKGFADIREL